MRVTGFDIVGLNWLRVSYFEKTINFIDVFGDERTLVNQRSLKLGTIDWFDTGCGLVGQISCFHLWMCYGLDSDGDG